MGTASSNSEEVIKFSFEGAAQGTSRNGPYETTRTYSCVVERN